MRKKLQSKLNLQSTTRLDNDNVYIVIDGDEITPDKNTSHMYHTFGSNFKLPNINPVGDSNFAHYMSKEDLSII